MQGSTLRTDLAAQLKALERESLAELGTSVESGRCWGALVEDMERICTEGDDYLALFDILVQLKEARALILFLSAVRHKSGVFEHVAGRADELPRVVQCALVSLPEFDDVEGASPDRLCAAARELLEDPVARREARVEYEAHMGHLRGMKWTGL